MERDREAHRLLMEETDFFCPVSELSCIIGNLFAGLDLPCEEIRGETALVLCGTTYSGKRAILKIRPERYTFIGDGADLKAVREGVCLERKCSHG